MEGIRRRVTSGICILDWMLCDAGADTSYGDASLGLGAPWESDVTSSVVFRVESGAKRRRPHA